MRSILGQVIKPAGMQRFLDYNEGATSRNTEHSRVLREIRKHVREKLVVMDREESF
jgi:hypothetical protein